MDYFSPRTPAAPKGTAGESSYADPALEGAGTGEGAGSPSYFSCGNGSQPAAAAAVSANEQVGDVATAAAAAAPSADGDAAAALPTPNPFSRQLQGQPTAFPVQNGATLAFQQALMQRHGSSAGGLGQLTAALPTPHGRRHQQKTSTSSIPHTSTSRLTAPISLSKSPRTPSISSPRKMESVSPPSSPDQHHSSPRKVPSGSSTASSSSFGFTAAAPRKSPRSPPPPSQQQQSSSKDAFAQFQAAANSSSRMPLQTPALKLPNFANKPNRSATVPQPNAGLGLRQLAGQIPPSTSGPSVCAPTNGAAARRGFPVQNPRFKAVYVPVELARILAEDAGTPHNNGNLQDETDLHARNKKLLILDMRPHTTFVTQGRFKGAINVCVPSTLLRRPNFGLQKIADTMDSRSDKEHFMHAVGLMPTPTGTAQVDRILLLDQELSVLTAESVIHSLLVKIEKSPFKGELYWLKGGWNLTDKCVDSPSKVARTQEEMDAASSIEEFVDWSALREDEEDEDDEMETDEAWSHDQATPQERSSSASLPVPMRDGGRSHSGSASSGSFASSADSLFHSSAASSHTTAHSLAGFDSSKMQLPDMRSSHSPAESSGSPSGAGSPGSGSKPSRTASGSSGFGSSASASSSKAPLIRPRKLPMSAFQFGSTAAGAANHDGGRNRSRRGSASGGSATSGIASRSASNAGTRNPSPTRSLTKLATQQSPHGHEGKEEYGDSSHKGNRHEGAIASQKKAAANPFFDNIRQNVESTSLSETLAHVKPFELPEEYLRPALQPRLPSFLQRLGQLSPQARSEKLHREYFELEQNEQKRIQKVLDWHCQQSAVVELEGKDGSKVLSPREDDPKTPMKMDGYHPFSISAGVEKGHLNRYKNIWPYEHARVRVKELNSPNSGDYINASHIQLRGSDKSYIASQGPLESTTEHFWKLVLQENVNVIVMLTLLAEGGRDKCSNYFRTADHGSISVRLIQEKGDTDAVQASVNQEVGFFTQDDNNTAHDLLKHHEAKGTSALTRDGAERPRLDSTTVRRTLEITDHSDKSAKGPKTIRHIQYIRWPDFDIPPDPECVLELIKETSRAQSELNADNTPVLVHCSAGVGRTGTFIAVDTLLDRYRQERRNKREAVSDMQVDGESSVSRSSSRGRRSHSDASASDRILNMTIESDSDASPRPSSPARFDSPRGSRSKSGSRPSSKHRDSSAPEALVRHLNRKGLQQEDRTDPVKSLVDQMREQRMNSVANAGQYLFTHLALYAGIVADLKLEGIDVSKEQ